MGFRNNVAANPSQNCHTVLQKWIKKSHIKVFKESKFDDVIKLWEGLGYYTRCKNMFNAAKLIKSSFPNNYEDLIKLPGIGDYTAKTILA